VDYSYTLTVTSVLKEQIFTNIMLHEKILLLFINTASPPSLSLSSSPSLLITYRKTHVSWSSEDTCLFLLHYTLCHFRVSSSYYFLNEVTHFSVTSRKLNPTLSHHTSQLRPFSKAPCGPAIIFCLIYFLHRYTKSQIFKGDRVVHGKPREFYGVIIFWSIKY